MRCGWVSSGVAADSDIRKVLRKGQWQLGIFELQNSGKLITGSGLFHLTSAFRISNSWIWSLQQLMAVRRQRLRLDTMCWSAASSTLGCKVWSCAVQMLEDMQLAALQLDLRCVSPHGIWQRAWHSLFEVRLLGLQCDVVAMNAHLAAGNWEKTNGLLYHMRVSELYPDAVTRTILVSQCSWEAVPGSTLGKSSDAAGSNCRGVSPDNSCQRCKVAACLGLDQGCQGIVTSARYSEHPAGCAEL